MGTWRRDQSKEARRFVWGKTRGEDDATCRDITHRMRAIAEFAGLRAEKMGAEIHLWRAIPEPSGKKYWTSCIRLIDDGWGYWSVMIRTDERRWRATNLLELPLSRALAAAAELYKERILDQEST